jgi:putative aldouronate transport system substrate-binding protein
MNNNVAGPTLSRRGFVRLASGSALLGVALPLLSACGGIAAPSSSSSAAATSPAASNPSGASSAPTVSAGAATGQSATGPYPSFVPNPSKPKPDFPARGPLYDDGYINYPANPTTSTTDAPGAGSNVVAFLNSTQPPPAPYDQNAAWQEVNKRLNANFQFNIVSQADYQAKMGALMAGNDLPDIIAAMPGINGVPNLAAFLRAQCADLTPYLGGDAVKDYPNLAAIPTYAWKNSGCAVNGSLYMLPLQRSAPGLVLLRNASIYDKIIGPDYTPKNADDFKRVAQQLTSPQAGRYALGSYQNQALNADNYSSLFGAPNNWKLDSSGMLTKNFETPQYKETVGYLRDLWAAGVFHPDIPTIPNLARSYDWWAPGKWVLQWCLWGNQWTNMWQQGLRQNPPFNALPIRPFTAHDGGTPAHFLSGGFLDTTALKKASPDRIRELLRIFNWLAAPFGSAEDLLLTSGLQGTGYNMDAQGNPVLTDRAALESTNVPFRYVIQRPQVLYQPDIPNFGKTLYDFEEVIISVAVADPTFGVYSNTNNSTGVPVTMAFKDAITDIMVGHRPMSDYDQVLKDWQTNAGNQIRTELQQALAAG